MIQIGDTVVGAVHLGISSTETVEISEIFLGLDAETAQLVFTAISSCYGSGWWLDDKYWIDDDFWIEN